MIGLVIVLDREASSDPEVRAAWERGEIDRIYPPELGWPDRASGPPPTRPA
jgi:hypothetical protein